MRGYACVDDGECTLSSASSTQACAESRAKHTLTPKQLAAVTVLKMPRCAAGQPGTAQCAVSGTGYGVRGDQAIRGATTQCRDLLSMLCRYLASRIAAWRGSDLRFGTQAGTASGTTLQLHAAEGHWPDKQNTQAA